MIETLHFMHIRVASVGEGGQTLVEYGLMAALISIVAITGLMAVGGGTGALYTTLKTAADYLKG